VLPIQDVSSAGTRSRRRSADRHRAGAIIARRWGRGSDHRVRPGPGMYLA